MQEHGVPLPIIQLLCRHTRKPLCRRLQPVDVLDRELGDRSIEPVRLARPRAWVMSLLIFSLLLCLQRLSVSRIFTSDLASKPALSALVPLPLLFRCLSQCRAVQRVNSPHCLVCTARTLVRTVFFRFKTLKVKSKKEMECRECGKCGVSNTARNIHLRARSRVAAWCSRMHPWCPAKSTSRDRLAIVAGHASPRSGLGVHTAAETPSPVDHWKSKA
jgi:hypothetical protein